MKNFFLRKDFEDERPINFQPIKCKIQLKEGKILGFEETKLNVLLLRKYKSFAYFRTIIFSLLSRVQNLFLLALLAIVCISQNYYRTDFDVILLLSLLIYFIKELLLDSYIFPLEKGFSEGSILKGNPELESFIEKPIKSLLPGNIILLEKGQKSPADLLILDSSEIADREAICYVKENCIEGCSVVYKKYACKLTSEPLNSKRKMDFGKYRKVLSGDVEYYKGSKNHSEEFKGLMKLTNDPKVEVLSIENFIPREGELKLTKWIIGLVLFTGMDCRMMQELQIRITKRNQYEIYLQNSFLLILAFVFILFIIIIPLHQGVQTVNKASFLDIFLSLTTFLPLESFIILDILQFFHKFVLERRFKGLTVLNPTAFSELPTIDYLLINKAGILTSEKYYVSQCFVEGKNYIFKENDIKEPKQSISFSRKDERNHYNRKKQENNWDNCDCDIEFGSEHTPKLEENIEKFVSHIKNLKFIDKSNEDEFSGSKLFVSEKISQNTINEKKKYSLLNISKDNNISNILSNTYAFPRNSLLSTIDPLLRISQSERYFKPLNQEMNFLQSLILCTKIKPFSLTTINPSYSDIIYESEYWEDSIIANFCNKWGVLLDSIKPTARNSFEYFYSINGRRGKTEIVAFHEKTTERKLFSLIYKVSPSQYTLLCRGSKHELLEKLTLNFDEKEQLESLISHYEEQGLIVIILAHKVFESNLAELYIQQYRNLKSSLINQKDQISELAGTIEHNLEFIGLIGIENQMVPEIESLISFRKNLGAKTWVLSGDNSSERLLSIMKKVEGARFKDFFLEKGDEEALIFSIKILLGQLKEFYGRKNRKTRFSSLLRKKEDKERIREIRLVINGIALENIRKNEYLLQSFRFICSLIPTLIGYNLSSNHKEWLAQMIKTSFPGSPKVLALGTIFSDGALLNSADLGIEFRNLGLGDLGLIHLSDLNEVLNRIGVPFCRSMILVLETLVLKALLLGFQSFLFMFFSEFSGVSFEKNLNFFYCLILMSPSFLISGLFPSKPPNKVLSEKEEEELINFMSMEKIRERESLDKERRLMIIDKENERNRKESNDKSFLPLNKEENKTLAFNKDNYKSLNSKKTLFSLNKEQNRSLLSMLKGHESDRTVNDYNSLLNTNNDIKFDKNLMSLDNTRTMLRSIGILIIKGILCAVLVIYYLIYSIRLNNRNNGLTYSLEIIQVLCLISNVFILNHQLMTHKASLLLFFMPFLTLGGFAFIEIITDIQLIMIICFNIFTCGLILFLIDLIVNIKIQKKNQKLALKEEISITKSVKKIFKNPKLMDPIIQEMFKAEEPSSQSLYLHPYNLHILDPRLNHQYLSNRKRKSIHFARIYFFSFLLIALIYYLMIFLTKPIDFLGFIWIGVVGVVILIMLLILTKGFSLYYYYMIYFILFVIILLNILLEWFVQNDDLILGGALIALFSAYSLNLSIDFLFVIAINLLYLISYTFKVVFLLFSKDKYGFLELKVRISLGSSLLLFQCSLIGVSLFLNYISEQSKRIEFLKGLQIRGEQDKYHDILALLMPKFVRMNIDRGMVSLAEEQEQGGVLFVDIVNFDEILELEGAKILEVLDSLYRAFDTFCISTGTQKIETVGKTYMAASGLKIFESEVPEALNQVSPPYRLIKLAFEMLKYTKQASFNKAKRISIRIGIHFGALIAGVIGYHKPQFSLIGDTVNTASRVCSTAEPDIVTVSSSLVKDYGKWGLYSYKERVVQAKGKGDLKTFQLEILNVENSVFKKKIGKALEGFKENKRKKSIGFKDIVSYFENNNKSSIRSSLNNTGTLINLQKANRSSEVFSENNLVASLLYSNYKPCSNIPKEMNNNNNDKIKNIDNSSNNNIMTDLINISKDISNNNHKINETKIDVTIKKHLRNNNPNSSLSISLISPNKSENNRINKNYNRKDLIIIPKGFFMRIPHINQEVFLRFLEETLKDYFKENRVLIGTIFIISAIRTLLMINNYKYYEKALVIFMFRGIFNIFILFPGVKLSLRTQKTLNLYKCMLSFLFLTGYIGLFFELFYGSIKENAICVLMEGFLIYLIQSNLSLFTFLEVILFSLGLLSMAFVTLLMNGVTSMEYYYILIAFFAFNIVKVKFSFKSHIKSFNLRSLEEVKKQDKEDLVSQLLPQHVFTKLMKVMNNQKVNLSDHFSSVTFLFADIAGFTAYSSSVKPCSVVSMLRLLFTEFDKHCLHHNVFKVYTIGDCYVAMGMVNTEDRDPLSEAKNVISFALDMISIIRNVRKEIDFRDLDMRIGVHTGSFIGGIVGTDLVRYDIYGQDVLIANKMESNGVAGGVMVSGEAKKLLEKDGNCGYKFGFRRKVVVKGLEREIDCFEMEGMDFK